MKKTFTNLDVELIIREDSTITMSPKKSTVDFLKQFARCYTCEPKLPKELCGFVNN